MNKKRIGALVLVFVLAVTAIVPAVSAEGRTVHIGTAEELQELIGKCRLDTYSEGLVVVLDNDIDLTGEAIAPFPIFCGTFIGGGHTVSGVTLSTDGASQGFFRFVQEDAVIRNLNVSGTVAPENIRTDVGGLVGSNYGTVVDCSFSGEVKGLEKVGGVVGHNYGDVRGCTFTGTVSGKRYSGGIAGYNEGRVDSCTNLGQINVTIPEETVNIDEISIEDISSLGPIVTANDSNTVTDSGGVAGLNMGVIKGSVNRGTVGYPHYSYNVGGIAGRSGGFITDCENAGLVQGRKDIGGVVGQMEPDLILSQTENLIVELKLMIGALNVAMDNLDASAEDTRAVMGELEDSAGEAVQSAYDVNLFSEDPIGGDLTYEVEEYRESVAEDDSSGWEDFKGGVADTGGKLIDDYNAIGGAETIEHIISGETTEEESQKMSETGGGIIADLDEKTGGNAGSFAESVDAGLIDRVKSGETTAEDEELISSAATDVGTTSADLLDKAADRIEERKTEKAREEAGDMSSKEKERYYDKATDNLSSSMGNMSDNIAVLNEQISDSTSQLAGDMKVVNSHFYNAMDILGDILSGSATVYRDMSDEDDDEYKEGKVFYSVNNGTVEGDIGVGGIAGDMGIEVEYDLEGTLVNRVDVDQTITNTYETRCVAKGCVNNGSVNGRKNNIGGCVGYTELGSVIACEGYGTVSSDEGSYVGGVVGRSDTVVRESYAMCEISGREYVGGIAGWGTKVRNCGSRVTVAEYIASVGAIAGWADVKAEDIAPENADVSPEMLLHVRGNRFVSDTLGGIDGVSYSGKAEPMSDEELLSDEALPDRFREMTITFTADGATVATATGYYGEALDAALIPAVPVKEGYTGYWPEYDFADVRSSDVLEAEYFPEQTTLASEQTREGSPMSMLVLNGRFTDRAALELMPYEDYGPQIKGCSVLESWEYAVTDSYDTQDTLSARFIMPEITEKNVRPVLYVMDGDVWVRTDTGSNGSYDTFDVTGNSGVFSIVAQPFKPDHTLLYCAVAGGAVLIIGAAILIARKKKKAAKAA